MNLDELKLEWSRISLDAEKTRLENLQLKSILRNERHISVRQRLLNRLRRQLTVCAIGPLWLIPAKSVLYNPVLYIAYLLFFVIMAILQIIQIHRLKEIDLSRMSVKDALVKTLEFRRLYHRNKIAGYILSAPVLALLFNVIVSRGDDGMIAGGIIGLVVGLAIGYLLDRGNKKLIRRMADELKRSLDDDSL